MTDRSYISENDASRHEMLGDLIAGLNESSFLCAAGSGWTVATTLCHLAFWDRRMLYLLNEWQAGRFETSRLTPQSTDSINHAVRVLSEAVPGREAGRLAIESATAVDAHVASVTDDLIERIVSAGFERILRRSLHRRDHLRKIRAALAA